MCDEQQTSLRVDALVVETIGASTEQHVMVREAQRQRSVRCGFADPHDCGESTHCGGRNHSRRHALRLHAWRNKTLKTERANNAAGDAAIVAVRPRAERD